MSSGVPIANIGFWTTQSGTPSRHSDYFWGELSFANSAEPLFLETLGLLSSGGVSNVAVASGNSFLPQTPEVFRYDGDGNLTNDGHWIYTWDAENRLTKMLPLSTVTDSGKAELIFAYDYQGRRLRKDVYGWYPYMGQYQLTSRFNFVHDGWNLIVELNNVNAILRKYLWGLDLSGSPQGAGGVGGLLDIADTANGIHFVAYDGNGDVAALASVTNSTVSGKYEYGPFGELIRKTGSESGSNPVRFSSKYQDDETDLLYFGYRYYNPSSGRWFSKDPISDIGFQLNLGQQSRQVAEPEEDTKARFQRQLLPTNQANPYRFVRNEPPNFLDLFGLITFEGCTPAQQNAMTAAFKDMCGNVNAKSFSCCMKASSIVYDLSNICKRDNLHVICHQNDTFWNHCKDKCGRTHVFRSIDGKPIIHMCADGLSENGCPPVGCTMFHEMTHTSNWFNGETWAQKTEVCLNCPPTDKFPAGAPPWNED